MNKYVVVMALAMLGACSHTVLVPVPPRVDLQGYGTLGIVEFGSNSERGISARATRQFQEQVQAAQPGTRFIDLGDRQALLSALGVKQLDPAAMRKIREKYGVGAIFLGDLAYSQPRVDVNVSDLTKLEGGMRAEMKGELSAQLLETASGASVWSSSGWVRRPVGSVSLSADHGVSGGMRNSDPREEMVPALVREVTQDFRPTTVRQPAN
jgi:hypothetical protein